MVSPDVAKYRFQLLREAQRTLSGNAMFDRFAKCNRVTISEGDITLCRSEMQQTAFFNGLMNCGSVWHCPHCSAKISACRCEEISHAIESHTKTGGQVAMITFTCQHTSSDSLGSLLSAQNRSFERFWRNGTVRRALDKVGCIGRITGVEVTVSKKNGWHPHRHVLLFIADCTELQLLELERLLQEIWVQSLVHSGLSAHLEIGLSLDGGKDKSHYLVKFAQEISLSQNKRGKHEGHYNPFALLDISEAEPEYFWARSRFVEYAETMKGHRQIIWSPGLKDKFKIKEISNDEYLNAPFDMEFLVEIPKADFNLIPDEYRQNLVFIANSGNSELLRQAFALLHQVYGINYTFFNESPELIEKRKLSALRTVQAEFEERRLNKTVGFRGVYSRAGRGSLWSPKDFRQHDLIDVPPDEMTFREVVNY